MISKRGTAEVFFLHPRNHVFLHYYIGKNFFWNKAVVMSVKKKKFYSDSRPQKKRQTLAQKLPGFKSRNGMSARDEPGVAASTPIIGRRKKTRQVSPA